MPAWLSAERYREVRESVPIACVDVIALGLSPGAAIERVGLILRDTPHQGRRWCLVGGRVLRDETLAEAVARHLRETLGPRVQFSLEPDAQPVYVSQYFPTRKPVGVIDPRQHSVAMNYCLPIHGPIVAAGEAHAFEWFPVNRLPERDAFGFEQDRVLETCMARTGVSFDNRDESSG